MSGPTAKRPVPGPAPDAAIEALESVQADWNAAALQWNPDELAAIYTEDALLFAGRPGISVGRQQIREYFVSYNGMLASTTLSLVDQHLIRLAPDTFLAQGYGKFHFVLAKGGESSTVLRTTLVLVRRGGRWKIIQHHFSTTPEAPPIPQ